MTRITSPKLAALAIALTFLLAACGSGDSDAAATATTSHSPTTTVAATTTTATFEPDTTTTEDTRTPEEAAVDRLDLMVVQLTGGFDNLVENSDCVVERLEAEEIPLTGQGTPELAALISCAPQVLENIIRIDPEAVPADVRTCLTATAATWIGDLTLVEATIFLESPAPPSELTTLLSTVCDVTEEEAQSLLARA